MIHPQVVHSLVMTKAFSGVATVACVQAGCLHKPAGVGAVPPGARALPGRLLGRGGRFPGHARRCRRERRRSCRRGPLVLRQGGPSRQQRGCAARASGRVQPWCCLLVQPRGLCEGFSTCPLTYPGELCRCWTVWQHMSGPCTDQAAPSKPSYAVCACFLCRKRCTNICQSPDAPHMHARTQRPWRRMRACIQARTRRGRTRRSAWRSHSSPEPYTLPKP